jgi:hypothetical protein
MSEDERRQREAAQAITQQIADRILAEVMRRKLNPSYYWGMVPV